MFPNLSVKLVGCTQAQAQTVRGGGWRVDKLANRTSFLRQLNALQDMVEVKPGTSQKAGVDPAIRDILVAGWDHNRAAINGILTGATSGPSEKKTNRGVDAYDVSTIRNEDVVILADGDYVVRHHTMVAKTHGSRDYRNVYCFVFRFDDAGRITYLTEHWNTWHAYNVLFNHYPMEPAHPEGRQETP